MDILFHVVGLVLGGAGVAFSKGAWKAIKHQREGSLSYIHAGRIMSQQKHQQLDMLSIVLNIVMATVMFAWSIWLVFFI